MENTDLTRRAAQQIAWTYPFATQTLVMRGALIYVRDGVPGSQAGGNLYNSSEICIYQNPSSRGYCIDLVTRFTIDLAQVGFCPSSWCKEEVGGFPARILIKTCEKGYFSNPKMDACIECMKQTTLDGAVWDDIGSDGCTSSPVPTTAAPTAAPTSTPHQCPHVVEGDFGTSCAHMCEMGLNVGEGATLCDAAATAILATDSETGAALLGNRTSFFAKHPSTGCFNLLKPTVAFLPFPLKGSPTYNRQLLAYAQAPYITVDGLPPLNGKCGTYELSVRDSLNGEKPTQKALDVLADACESAGGSSTRRLCCCTTAAPPSPAAPNTNIPLDYAVIAGSLLCAALTGCVFASAVAAYICIAARRRRRNRSAESRILSEMPSRESRISRISALSEISKALLEPEASFASGSSADSVTSDDARARRIVEQGLWIDPDTIVVGRKLAAGGMGELRLGRMTLPAEAGKRGSKTKVTVVLKSSFIEMLGGDADEFWHEASMLSQIKHPQVVRLFGVTQKEVRGMLKAETQNRLFLVMEYCANGSLTDAVKRLGGYNRKRDFLRHAEQITSTLAWLHAQGIVHRDIKPSNVLLDDEGDAKLCDLGLSRFQPGIGPGATPSVGFTSATMTVGAGSAPYMPPEGLADTPGPQGGDDVRQRHYDGRAWDIYSLAILLTQMWTGKELYRGLGVFQIVVRVSQGMRPKLSANPREVPPRLREIVSAMWDADRHARPSAEEVLGMLQEGGVLAAQIDGVQ